uniref:Secreted protein n=1 Tax=Kalanchoe fedtschenkoi TaxID=63787 RepID=A0A7N0TZK1_KALFE
MLELFFAMAFSAVPLILYVPPVRSSNRFVATLEDIFTETHVHMYQMYPRLRHGCSRIVDRILDSSSSRGNNRLLLHPIASNTGTG